MFQALDVRPQHRRPEARVVQPELVGQLSIEAVIEEDDLWAPRDRVL